MIQTCAGSKVAFPDPPSWSAEKGEKEEDDGILYRVEPHQSMGSIVQAVPDRDENANLLQQNRRLCRNDGDAVQKFFSIDKFDEFDIMAEGNVPLMYTATVRNRCCTNSAVCD